MKKSVAILVLFASMAALTACKSIANIIAPPPEDISAVRMSVAKQGEATDLAFKLHKESLQSMHDMGIDEAMGRIRQATLDEIHKASASSGTVTPDQIDAINKQADVERAISKKAWDGALAAGLEPQAWKDLRLVQAALDEYIMTRMGAEEQKNDLMLKAHDLVQKGK